MGVIERNGTHCTYAPKHTKQTISPKRSCDTEPDGVKKTGRQATASLRAHSKISNHQTRSSYLQKCDSNRVMYGSIFAWLEECRRLSAQRTGGHHAHPLSSLLMWPGSFFRPSFS